MNRIIYTPNQCFKAPEVSPERKAELCRKTVQLAERIVSGWRKLHAEGDTVSMLGDAFSMIFRFSSYLPAYLPLKDMTGGTMSSSSHLFASYILSRYTEEAGGKDMILKLLEQGTSGIAYDPFALLRPEDIAEIYETFEGLDMISSGDEIWLGTVPVTVTASYLASVLWSSSAGKRDERRLGAYMHYLRRLGCVENTASDPEIREALARAADDGAVEEPLNYLKTAYQSAFHGRNPLENCDRAEFEKNLGTYGREVRNAISSGTIRHEGNVALLYINFGNLSSYISSFWRLKDYAAASVIVDTLVSSLPFSLIDRTVRGFLPPENMPVQYGGHSYMLVPMGSGESAADLVSKVRELAGGVWDSYRANVEISAADYLRSGRLYYDHSRMIFLAKISAAASFRPRVYSYGMHRRCDSCGEYPAVHEYRGGVTEYLCEACYRVNKFSDTFKMGAKVNAPYLVFSAGRPLVISPAVHAEEPMDYIATGGYMTVAKFDGNSMGRYFISEDLLSYTAKSSMIYWQLTKSYGKAVEGLAKRNSEAAHRAVAGTIYLAGDEGIMLLPPDHAPFFLYSIAGEISSTMNIKVGMLTVKADSPASTSIGVAEALSNDSKIEGINSLAALTTQGVITESSYRSIAKEMTGMKLYSQKVPMSYVKEMLDHIPEGQNMSSVLNEIEGIASEAAIIAQREDGLKAAVLYSLRKARRHESEIPYWIVKMAAKDYANGTFNILWYLFLLKGMIIGVRKND